MNICCSSNGQYVYQATIGTIYSSNNYGVSFTPCNTVSTEWQGISCSGNGAYVIASTWGGEIYNSSNNGSSWTKNNIPQEASCGGAYISSNAQMMFTFYMGGKINKSTNSGGNWSATQIDGSTNIFYPAISIAASSSCNIIYVSSGGFSNQSIMSTNSGTSWTTINVTASAFTGIACSSDGKIVYLVADGGNIYKSTNTGSTWTPYTNLGTKRWRSICCSSDGKKVTVCTYGSGIYQSLDGGSSWYLIPNDGSNFNSVCCSSDGSVAFVSVNQGDVYSIK
jgi:photosystem II stability/assembly factor-like uncharacterized protein